MKTFVCILALAVASCKAGFEGSHSEGHEDSGQNAPSGGYDYQAQAGNHISGEQGHGFGGAVSSFGQGHDFGAAQAHGGGQNHDFGGQFHGFGGQLQGFGGQAQAFGGHDHHNFAPAQGHNFGGAQGHNNAGAGHNQDFSLPLLQHLNAQLYGNHAPQARGFDVGGHGDSGFGASAHGFQGDSYVQAAHDLGLQGDFGGYSSGGENQDHSGESQEANEGHGHGQENHQGIDLSNLKEFTLEDGGDEFGHGHQNLVGDGHDFGHAQAIPVGEHTDVETPVSVPQYKHVTYPIPKTIHVSVPKPILVGVPQPYPVKVPVHKPVAVPVETEINIPVEKVVPYPVVKHVPYPVEKHVPIKIEKTVTVHVPQPYPVKIPVYKTIHHHKDH